MVVDQELEHFHRVIAVDIEGAVEKFDDLGTIFNQIEQIRLYPFNIVIPHTHLNARQAELAVERTTPAGLKIDNPLAEIRQIIREPVRGRQGVQIAFGTRGIDDQLFALAVCRSIDKMKFAVIPQLLQQMVEGLFPVAVHDKINPGLPLHPVKRLIRYFRPAEHNRNLRHHLLEYPDQLHGLFDVPYITRKSDHIRFLLEEVGHDIHHGVFDGIFRQMDILKLMLAVRLQQTDGQ
ncbi:hypothetical protein D3C75_777150 [compost metagenome]